MVDRALRIGIALSGDSAAFWRGPLARKLRALGHEVGFVAGPCDVHPPGLVLLEALERLVRRRPEREESERPPQSQDSFDLIVAGSAQDPPAIALCCDGAPCALGAVSAILEGRPPVLEARLIRSDGSAALLARLHPALEDPDDFLRSRSQIAERLADAAAMAVRRFAAGESSAEETVQPGEGALRSAAPHPLAFATRALSSRIAARLTRIAGRAPVWRIAWRRSSGDEAGVRGVWPPFAYRDLPDDGRRFYADPFVCAAAGRTFVFCEEFPFAAGKGAISVFEISEGQVVAPPRPVLERPYHLSYPMIFSRDGAIWMIPESSAATRIELWRAERFPDRWTPAGVLVEGVAASDATLLERDGRLWLFATVAEGAGSSWDSLHLWSADRLEGPWRPHAANPVLVDASCARPAGSPIRRPDGWLRPAQDCSRLYGGGLALCSIDRLDDEAFQQTVRVRLAPPAGSSGLGVHTLNAAANIEAIDIFGPRPSMRGRHAGRPKTRRGSTKLDP